MIEKKRMAALTHYRNVEDKIRLMKFMSDTSYIVISARNLEELNRTIVIAESHKCECTIQEQSGSFIGRNLVCAHVLSTHLNPPTHTQMKCDS